MDISKQFGRGWMLAIAASALAVVLLVVGVARLRRAEVAGDPLNPVPPTEQLPRRVAVVALGRLEPRGEVIRVSGPTGERIARLEVAQGDWIESNGVIAYLETYRERQSERDLAASQLAEAEIELAAEIELGRARVQEAITRLEQVDRPAAFEIEARAAAVRELEAELKQEEDDLRRFERLFAEGAISKQELERQQTTVAQFNEQINNARALLVQLQTARETDMSNARAQLRAARADLELAQVKVAVESARRNLELAEARLERTIIRAPQTGRILQVLTKAGEAIAAEDGIVDLGDTSQMYAVAEVYETDVSLVRQGQPATVSSRNGAFDRPLEGTVEQVGWQIFKNDVLDDDPAANADSRVVEVKIRIDDSDRVAALTNLQVDVRIELAASASPSGGTTGASTSDSGEPNLASES
ncbi:HlyD family efflux transporter periplasmic adaptor subunit [Synechococcus sp. PCC 7336]|uniref:efflux RND transporter periplasmic adaptor subunit n=1 Tax=Synechococcus sp. PCC 7336 TaxID=195250 RepID=UPI000376C470|nr:HlyD family efflux transporter periplasmic adaptor subunit [Synechococcus sp. PCC 7336]